MWTHRIILEALEHEHSCFVTLTYDDDHLPDDNNVHSSHLTEFFKKLRARLNPEKLKPPPQPIRYYAVGEYGDDTGRPHYHMCLFNYPNCMHGQSRYSRFTKNCCNNCDLIRDVWGSGNVLLGELTPNSAQYTAGYIIKKMETELGQINRTPEFQRMSNRPGLGVKAMHDIASELMRHDLHKTLEDVPVVLRHGKKKLPLGRYLRTQLRELIGRDKKAPQSVHDKLQEEMRPLREASKNSKEGDSIKKLNNEVNKAAHQKMDGRDRIYNQRKIL